MLLTIASVAAIAVCAGVFVAADSSSADGSGVCGDNLTWEYTGSDRTLAIAGYGDMYDFLGLDEVPWHDYARRVSHVILPEGLTHIGSYAFAKCWGLESFEIPENVRSVGYRAFYSSHGLIYVSVPSSVTFIGKDAFQYCDYLEEINVDTDNGFYSSESGILYSKDRTVLIRCPSGTNLTSLDVPASVNIVVARAFEECRSLISVHMPCSVETVGEEVFQRCCSLTAVNIPDSVKTIGQGAFCGCQSLGSADIPRSVNAVNDWTFFRCSSLTAVNIPDSVKTIGRNAFGECCSLGSVVIPGSVETIGVQAFSECTGLRSVLIHGPDNGDGCASLKVIGGSAFLNCRELISFTFPGSLVSIGEGAFEGCESLTVVYDRSDLNVEKGQYGLPDSVEIVRTGS